MSVYGGPSDIFIFNGKEYKQGDNIPMAKELQRHHEQFGHRFENTPEAAPIAPTVQSEPVFGVLPADAPVVAKTP